MNDNFKNIWILYQTAKVLIEKITHLENEIEELKRRQNVHR